MIVHYGQYGQFRFAGFAGPNDATLVYLPPPMTMTGPSVTDLQVRLNTIGVAVPINGTFDQATQQGVINFQNAYGIPSHGTVDAATWAQLHTETDSKVGTGQATAASANAQAQANANIATQAQANNVAPPPPPPSSPAGAAAAKTAQAPPAGGGGAAPAAAAKGAAKASSSFPWGYVVLGLGALGLGVAAFMPSRRR